MGRKRTRNLSEPAVPAEPLPPIATKRRQVNLDEDLWRKAGMISAWKDVTLPDYINNRVRPLIEADLASMIEEMGVGPLPPPPPSPKK